MTRQENQTTSNAKVGVELFRAGEFKDLFNNNRELTATERMHIQERTNNIYSKLLALIARNRSLSLDAYTTWAEGKIFLAPDALQLGLIDEIGTILEAENKLVELIRNNNLNTVFTKDIYYVSE